MSNAVDLILRDALVIDGTGAAPVPGDVAVRDGRVVAVGDVDASADRVVEVDGRVVCPGFVDVHTHLDAQAFWDPQLSPSPLHGVTTALAGNCGFTIAPLSPETGAYLMPMLARVEGMPLESLRTGVPWDWSTTAEYLDRLDGDVAINVGFMVGHSAMRSWDLISAGFNTLYDRPGESRVRVAHRWSQRATCFLFLDHPRRMPGTLLSLSSGRFRLLSSGQSDCYHQTESLPVNHCRHFLDLFHAVCCCLHG